VTLVPGEEAGSLRVSLLAPVAVAQAVLAAIHAIEQGGSEVLPMEPAPPPAVEEAGERTASSAEDLPHIDPVSCSAASNTELVLNLEEAGLITHPALRRAFRETDRAAYVPEAAVLQGKAYADAAQSLGYKVPLSCVRIAFIIMDVIGHSVVPNAPCLTGEYIRSPRPRQEPRPTRGEIRANPREA